MFNPKPKIVTISKIVDIDLGVVPVKKKKMQKSNPVNEISHEEIVTKTFDDYPDILWI